MFKVILFIIVLCSVSYSQVQNRNHHQPEVSNEVIQLQNKMKEAKYNGKVSESVGLQKQIDALTGESITTSLKPLESTVKYNNFLVSSRSSVIGVTQITDQANIRSIATVTEQRGSTAGRIWSAYTYSAGTGDAIAFYYSDDDGLTWQTGANEIFGTGIRMKNDELDIELLETDTSKYIYAVFGYTINSSLWRSGVTVYKISGTPSLYSFQLFWPGTSDEDYYYSPRICSDNAAYINNPYIYIISNYDSTKSGGYESSAKTAVILDPIGASSVITFRNRTVYAPTIYFNPYNYDLAFFRNGGGDSVAIVETGLIDTHCVFVSAVSISNFTGNSNLGKYIQANSRVKTHGYIASNGAYSRLMYVCREKYSSQFWDIRYHLSSNGTRDWANGYVDGRFVNKSRPDIVGKKNSAGSFYCAYTTINTFDSVFYATTTNYSWNSIVGPVNSLSSATVSGMPRPGFKHTLSDDCFTLWAPSAGGVYATYGCGPIVIGIQQNGNTIPSSYKLEQNYPNPFNPVTNIKFSIPKAGNVMLIVYDMLGREVSVLVNKQLSAGNYNVDMDASGLSSGVYFYKIISGDYSEVKKMMLVK